MNKASQLVQALEEGKVLSKTSQEQREFILSERGKIVHYTLKERPKTINPLDEIVRHPERWEIISVQKFEKLYANS